MGGFSFQTRRLAAGRLQGEWAGGSEGGAGGAGQPGGRHMCLVPTCDTCSAVGIDGTPESGHIASSSYSVSQSSTQIRTHTTAHEHYYLHMLALGELTYVSLFVPLWANSVALLFTRHK